LPHRPPPGRPAPARPATAQDRPDTQGSTAVAVPFPQIAKRHPEAIQRLDRAAGTITVVFRAIDDSGWARTVFEVPPCPPGASIVQRQRQDAAIALLDDFADAAFKSGHTLLSLATPRLGTDGREIRAGRLPLARLNGRGWETESDNVAHALKVLTGGVAHRTALAVRDWPEPPYPLPREPRQVRSAGRLRLIVQLEEDLITAQDAASRVLRHPSSTVLIQADPFGGHRVVYGAAHLSDGLYRRQVKVELGGHGGRREWSDEMALSGYTSEALAARLGDLLDRMRFPLRIDQVNLTACALESLVFPRSFAAEFLMAAHERRLLQPDATVTAYANDIKLNIRRDTGEKALSRATFLADLPEIHAPGKTFVYKRDPMSGEVLCCDKYAQSGFHPIDAQPAVGPVALGNNADLQTAEIRGLVAI
jgi:hypothetical protein